MRVKNFTLKDYDCYDGISGQSCWKTQWDIVGPRGHLWRLSPVSGSKISVCLLGWYFDLQCFSENGALETGFVEGQNRINRCWSYDSTVELKKYVNIRVKRAVVDEPRKRLKRLTGKDSGSHMPPKLNTPPKPRKKIWRVSKHRGFAATHFRS